MMLNALICSIRDAALTWRAKPGLAERCFREA